MQAIADLTTIEILRTNADRPDPLEISTNSPPRMLHDRTINEQDTNVLTICRPLMVSGGTEAGRLLPHDRE